MSDFKVGDWVVVKDSKTVFKVADVFKDGYTWYAPSIKLEPRSMWDSGVYGIPESQSHLELWQPKEGEWCWSKYDGLVQILKITDERYIVFPLSTSEKDCTIEYRLGGLEPFIGELPGFIKDK